MNGISGMARGSNDMEKTDACIGQSDGGIGIEVGKEMILKWDL